MKFYKNDGKGNEIPFDAAVSLTLDAAIGEIDAFPESGKDDDFFIGFENDEGQAIQFVKSEGGEWLLDVPVVERGRFAYSLQANDLSTEAVKAIVTNFEAGRDWRHLCKLEKSESVDKMEEGRSALRISRLDDLSGRTDEIAKYLRDQSLNIFYGEDVSASEGVEIRWKDRKVTKDGEGSSGWKEFVNLGKAEGMSTVVVEELLFDRDDVDRLEEEFEDVVDKNRKEMIDAVRKVVGKVGGVRLIWIKNGIKYSYYESTDWYDGLAKVFQALDREEKELEEVPISRYEGPGLLHRPLPESVKRESPEILAEEMIAFVKKEYGGLDTKTLFSASRVFWDRKGVSRFGDGDAQLLIDKVEGVVQGKIAEMEKGRIPDLVGPTVSWCKENGFRKLTKQNLKAFLAEKNESLSKTSEDILLTRVNIKLSS